MNRTDMYRRAIKRTFANLYSVSSSAGKTFLHPILSEPDDDAPQFTCPEEDPVIVTLMDDERSQIESARSNAVGCVMTASLDPE